MEPPLSRTPLYLPVRLTPRRKLQHAMIGLQALGLLLLAYAMSKPFEGDWRSRAAEGPIAFDLLIGVLVILLLAVAATLAVSLLRLVPGSPFSHVTLTRTECTIRRPFGRRHFEWSALGRFAAVTAPHDYEQTFIVAPHRNDEAGIQSDQDRYRRAAFRLRSDPYCSHNDADLLAGWLNEVRSAVSGGVPRDVAFFVPAALARNIIPEPAKMNSPSDRP
jgi:hypothetical protein